MNPKACFSFVSFILTGLFALVACGGSNTGSSSPNQAIGSAGENYAFDKTTMTVPAGQKITVSFKNNSQATQHNWVLVNGGDTVAAQVDAAAVNDATDYIPDNDPNIIGHTTLVDPGQSATAEFQAPGPGTYTYMCTYPAHYASGMKGTLTVQ